MIRLTQTILLLVALTASSLARAEVYPSPAGRLRFLAGKDADGAAQLLAKTADEDRAWAARELGRDYDGITDVRVARDADSFAALQPPSALVPPWASGVAYPALNLVVLRVDAHERDPRALLRHELSHVAVGRLTAGRAPRWLLEGLAVVHSGNAWSEEGPSLMQAALSDSLFSFEELSGSFPASPFDAELAYAQSAAFVKYLIDHYGEDKVQDVLRELVKGDSFDLAVIKIMGATPRQLENAWRRSLSKWEMVIRLVTSSEFFWGVATLLCAFAGIMHLRRRRKRLQAMAREEEAQTMRTLLRTPAVWADQGIGEDESEDASTDTELEEESDDLISEAGDDDELPEHLVGRREVVPKKPTLH